MCHGDDVEVLNPTAHGVTVKGAGVRESWCADATSNPEPRYPFVPRSTEAHTMKTGMVVMVRGQVGVVVEDQDGSYVRVRLARESCWYEWHQSEVLVDPT
jgi:hypothetical protein